MFPQENGNRADVRWVRFTDAAGTGLHVAGAPVLNFTARRWTSEDLDTARHPTDLRPRDHVVVNLDHALHGIGSAALGPPPLPPYELLAEPVTFSRKLNGKTLTRRLTAEQAQRYRDWIANRRTLDAHIDQMDQLSRQVADLLDTYG